MKSHRGISAVVGTVFLIAIVVGALTYISSSLDTMANFSEQLIAEESRQKNIQDEKFDLLSVDVVGTTLDATIKNTGDIPIKITTLYLDEMDNQDDVVQKINIDTTIAPGNSFDLLSESIDVVVDPTKGYSMKFISSRGEVQTFYLNSASQEPIDIQLIAMPDRIPTGFTTTLMMIVVNNMSNNNPLVNLTPIDPTCAGICNKLSGPIPVSYDTLDPGDVAIFEWTYELNGNADQSVTFFGEVENGYPLNRDSETVTIATVEISELAGQAIESLGFGQSTLADDILVLHIETYGVPPSTVPENPSGIPDPIHNYELNGDATDEMGGTDLQLSDSGTGLTSTGWDFAKGDEAQIVSGDIPDTEYAIEMVLQFGDLGIWPRILSFNDNEGAFSGHGAEWALHGYNDGYGLEFWNIENGGSEIGTATFVHLLIQRTASEDFEVYMDGSLAFTFVDTSANASLDAPEATFLGSASDGEFIAQPATFFNDNTGEESAGIVDCIRIFDEALSSANAITITSDSDTCYNFGLVDVYQMTPGAPESSGTTHIFPTTGNQLQFFSSNSSANDITISPGVWNASLRYNHAALPSELNIADIGMKLHFEETNTSTGIYDSGNDSDCYGLAEAVGSSVSGSPGHHTDRGVNGTGVYEFDGDTDITIKIDGREAGCINIHHQDYSVSGWFNATINDDYDAAQFLFTVWDPDGDGGGFHVKLGDGSENTRGQVRFTNLDDDGATLQCNGDEPDGNGGRNYVDGEWHHFVATMKDTTCTLYVDGVEKDTQTGGGDGAHWDMDLMVEDYHIGIDKWGGQGFTGYIDDIMFWYDLEMSQTQVTALKNFSFGNNATNMNFYLNNATGPGDTLDVLAADTNVGLPWGDPHRRNSNDVWLGGNWTKYLSQIILREAEPLNRLNFTMSYASGEPMNFRIDDENLDGVGGELISSYLHVPGVEPELPVFRFHDRDNKITFFTYNGEDEGNWFTYEGTRIIFNGTNGHYTGVVDSVSTGSESSNLDLSTDSPFVEKFSEADITFWHPQNIPIAQQPGESEKIAEGMYDVTVYLNGYDEDGSVILRSIAVGDVLVVE